MSSWVSSKFTQCSPPSQAKGIQHPVMITQWDSSLLVLPEVWVQFPTMAEYFKGSFPDWSHVRSCPLLREYQRVKCHPLGKKHSVSWRSLDAWPFISGTNHPGFIRGSMVWSTEIYSLGKLLVHIYLKLFETSTLFWKCRIFPHCPIQNYSDWVMGRTNVFLHWKRILLCPPSGCYPLVSVLVLSLGSLQQEQQPML